MHNPYFRNWVFFLLGVIFVVSAKEEVVNALFSLWAGGWVMAKLFKYLFNVANDSASLTFDKFILRPHTIMFDLLAEPDRKQRSLVVVWWSAGILTVIITYKLLNALLIS